jgi:hypothetical protein
MPGRIVYTNKRTGEKMTLEQTGPFYLVSAGNLGTAAAEAQTQRAPYQEGETYITSRLRSRSMEIQFFIKAEDETDLKDKRRTMARVFNPKDGEGTLEWQIAGITRNIKAVPDPGVVFPGGQGTGPNWQRGAISLLAADPLFFDPVLNEPVMAAFLGGLSFKFSFPMSFSTAGAQVDANNAGDVDTPVDIEFHGPALNPKVKNETTGKQIRVARELQAGDVLTITTGFGNKTVTITRADGTKENAMHYLDDTSEFWHLEPGINVVSYSEEGNNLAAEVLVKWYNKFIGL